MTDPVDAPPLAIATARHAAALVLSVAGDVDVATGPGLRAAFAQALGTPEVGTVVADLTGVTFLGSTGIAVLVDANWEAGQRGKQLRLVVGGTRAVARPVEAAGLTGLFAEYADVASALTATG